MAYRYRLYPTSEQEDAMMFHILQTRRLWNLAVEQLRIHYRCLCLPSYVKKEDPKDPVPPFGSKDLKVKHRTWCLCGSTYGRDETKNYRSNNTACRCGSLPTLKELMRQLTELRDSDDYFGRGAVMIQQQVLRDFDQARQNWWKRPDHFRPPAFHRTSDRGSFRVVNLSNSGGMRQLNAFWADIKLPKVPGRVRFKTHAQPPSDPKSARIVREADGRWFISFPGPQPSVDRSDTPERMVGIDRGVAHTLVLSTGEVLDMPYKGRFLTPGEEKRLLRLQRTLARRRGPKKKQEDGGVVRETPSGRYEHARRQKAKLEATQRRRRKDWVEKITTHLVSEYDVIVVEKLKLKNMTKKAKKAKQKPEQRRGSAAAKRGLNRSLLAQAHGLFLQRLKDKAEASGVVVIEVPAQHTSQRCADCGYTTKENRVTQAQFRCVSCGHTSNADLNAAVNILKRGLGEW